MPTFQITGPDGKKYRVTGDSPEGAMAALRKMTAEPTQGHQNVPEFVPPGVEGYNPETGLVERQFGKAASAAYGAADTATSGFGDELASFAGSALTGVPREQVLAEMRANQAAAKEQNPKSYLGGQIAGGVAQGVAAGPASFSARAGSTLLPRVAAGAADAGILGAAYGAGSGEDAQSRATEALKSGAIGAALGGAFPLVSTGASKVYGAVKDAFAGRAAAQQAGAAPETLRMLGDVMEADASLGSRGQANMAAAGKDAMLADAGPNARAVLDTAIQRGGSGATAARDAIGARTERASHALTDALDDALGAPQGVTATRSAIREGSAPARSSAYDKAYAQAIDYADPRAMQIEEMVSSRVPGSAIRRANELMRAEGHKSQQILADISDNGDVTFKNLPDVRQLDYITRALNDLAEAGEGAGAMGGQNALGRAYQGLSSAIRGNLRELVPEYAAALETAADPIRRSKAVELGSKILSSSFTRDQAEEAVRGMTQPEKEALAQGIRSQIDDAMALVSRTVQDDDTGAREAIKALRDLSSRSNREKVSLAIGADKADKLFRELDRVAKSFNLRASVAENSKTYARQAVDQRVSEITAPGVIGTAAQGKPINATQRLAQMLTGQTPEKIKGREDAIYSELASLLTQPGGAGQNVYEAVGKLGATDQATKLMSDRISRALLGPQYAYPLVPPLSDRMQR